MIVVLSDRAERDLETNGGHIARDKPDRAPSFAGELRDRGLADVPERLLLIPRYAEKRIRRRIHSS